MGAMSWYQDGHTPWNKGRKMPEDFGKRISNAQKGRRHRLLSVEEEGVREEAIQRGDKFYFFSRPCPKGHVSKRYIRHAECHQCRMESLRKRRAFRSNNERGFLLHRYAQQRAREFGLDFSITIGDIEEVWPKDNRCPVLGMELKPNRGKGRAQPHSPSLDRLDPAGGYVKGNIAVISYKANLMKSSETNPKSFEAMARWLRSTQKGTVNAA